MEIGKFPPELLSRLLAKNSYQDSTVIVGPGLGEDAAIIEAGGGYLVAKSDPVTFATDQIGWYAVQVNANDVACTGGIPRWFLATLLIPERFSPEQAEAVFDQILEACREQAITLVGGHSEVTYGLERPIVVGCMLGEVAPDRMIRTGGAQEGDSIVITKGVAIEGTSLLARDHAEALRQVGVSARTLETSITLLSDPGISVVKEAQIASSVVSVHSFHDPTEGGLITGLREVATASGMGLAIEESSVPVLPECREICDALQLDPLGLLASGTLLITLDAAEVPTLLAALERAGIDGWEIGQIIAPEKGLIMIGYEGEVPLPEYSRDELARYYATAAKG